MIMLLIEHAVIPYFYSLQTHLYVRKIEAFAKITLLISIAVAGRLFKTIN